MRMRKVLAVFNKCMWVYKQGVLIMLKSFGYSKNGAIFK